jgi:hypothetical protein
MRTPVEGITFEEALVRKNGFRYLCTGQNYIELYIKQMISHHSSECFHFWRNFYIPLCDVNLGPLGYSEAMW